VIIVPAGKFFHLAVTELVAPDLA